MDYSLVVGHEHGGTVGSTRNFLNGINNIVGGGDHGKSTSGALAEFNTNQSLVVGTNNTFYRDSNGDNDSNIVGGYANVLKNARLNLVVGEQNTLNSGSNIAFSGAKGNLVGGYSNDIYQGSNYNIIAGQNNTLSSSSNGSSALINSIIAGTGVQTQFASGQTQNVLGIGNNLRFLSTSRSKSSILVGQNSGIAG